MRTRRRTVAALGPLGCLLLAVACASTPNTVKITTPSAAIGAVVDGALPASIADLPLTEANGTRTDLAAFRGKTVMVADFMTLCTDICPMISANTATLARALSRDGLAAHTALLEISIDPHRDTPARLRAYQRLYGPRPTNWYLLRATPAGTRRLWRYFGVYVHRVPEGAPPDRDWLTGKPLTYDISHSDDVIFLNTAGQERFVIDGNPDIGDGSLPPRLRADLTTQGLQLLRHPNSAEDWTTAQAMQVFDWLLDRHLPEATP